MISSWVFRLGDNKILAGASACFDALLFRPKIYISNRKLSASASSIFWTQVQRKNSFWWELFVPCCVWSTPKSARPMYNHSELRALAYWRMAIHEILHPGFTWSNARHGAVCDWWQLAEVFRNSGKRRSMGRPHCHNGTGNSTVIWYKNNQQCSWYWWLFWYHGWATQSSSFPHMPLLLGHYAENHCDSLTS